MKCIALALALSLGGCASADSVKQVHAPVKKQATVDANHARLNAAFAAFIERKYHEAKR